MSSSSSRSSTDPLSTARTEAVARILDAVSAVEAANPVVLIDGRSGAGKTTVARELVARWPLHGPVQLVAMDWLYPGWDGLADGVQIAREQILVPHARGMVGIWHRWDWDSAAPAEPHGVDPALPLILEGSGVLTAVTARLSDVRVWIESPTDSRRKRALARDADGYAPHWTRWAQQEEHHLVRDDPRSLATVLVALP